MYWIYEPSYPGCVIPAKVIGALKMFDNGKEDYKIISVVAVDPRYNDVNTLDDLSSFVLDEIKNFFENYKTLQNIPVDVLDYYGKEEAFKVIESSKQRYNDLRKK